MSPDPVWQGLRGRGVWLAPALLALAATAVYLNALANGFAFDDVHIIQYNPRVHDLQAQRDIWLLPYWPQFGVELGLYRPFIIFLYALQWAAGGGEPWVFHAVSLLLHAAATLLVYRLLTRVTAAGPAFVGALIFAVHPVHTEAVANIVGQAELVAAICMLAACLIHAGRPAGTVVPWRHRAGLVVLYTVALLTKESAVVLPALLVALDLAQRRVGLNRSGLAQYARDMLMPLTMLALALAAYLVLRMHVLAGTLTGLDVAPALPHIAEHRLLNALRAFPEFLRLLVVPMDLAADYAPGVILPVEHWTPMVLLGGLLLASVVALAVVTPWWPAVGLPAAWFMISMLTVSNLFFPIGVLVAERLLYAPSIAVAIAVAYGWQAVARAAKAHRDEHSRSVPTLRLATAVVMLVVVVFGARTWVRNPDWRDTDAMIAGLFRDYPESYRAQWMHGHELFRHGRNDEAEAHFTLAYRLYPRDGQFLMSFASFLMALDRPDRAIELLEEIRGLSQWDYTPAPTRLLAHAFLMVGRYDDALSVLDDATARNIGSFGFHPLRAYAHHGRGEHRRAVASWRAALDDPRGTTWVTRAFLARALAMAGSAAEAEAVVADMLRELPDSASAEGVEQFRRAVVEGCYGRTAEQSAEWVFGACDPLGDWFVTLGQTPVPTALHRSRRAPDDFAGTDQQAVSNSR